ncbi:MAG TPA: hypothetical protein VJ804_09205 [Acidimicrobiales bacterium]|nr:hypothetical protein [Acidimicrobiales bacterium]
MELEMDRWQRRVVFGVMPVVMVGIVVVTALVTYGDLPDPVATRFHPDGHATASTHRASWLVVQLIIAVLCAGLLVRIGRKPRPDAPILAATAAFVGFLTGSLWVFVSLANRHHVDWHDVTLGNGAIAGALGGAIGWTIPVVLMARRIAPPRPAYPNRAIAFGPDERPAWFGHTTSVGFAVAGAANITLGVLIALVEQVWVGALVFGIGLLLVSFASVVVTIDERGVGVRSGPFGWPRIRLPLGLVEEAEPTHLGPTTWGGWGYRGSLRLFRRAAWVVRSGPGLRLQLVGGQRFFVSVDDADEAAAVLNGLVARAGAMNASE